MRKQDNSKLIYLLIGVVAVFILVFQYKSWCSAAEFDIVEKYSEEVEEVLSSIPLEEVVVDDEGVSGFIPDAHVLEATSETVVQNFDDSAIVEELKKSNEYWEMFLDSFVVTDTVSSEVSLYDLAIGLWSLDSTSYSSGAFNCLVFPCNAGVSYDFYFNSANTSAPIYLSFCSFLPFVGTPCSFVTSTPPSTTFFTYDAPFDGYIVISQHKGSSGTLFASVRYLSSHLESYTLSELGNAVIQNGNNVSEILVYVLITCCFVCCFISLQIAWHTRSQIRKWSGRSS